MDGISYWRKTKCIGEEGVSQNRFFFFYWHSVFGKKMSIFVSGEHSRKVGNSWDCPCLTLPPSHLSAKQCKNVKAADREADTVGQRPWNSLLTSNIQSQATFSKNFYASGDMLYCKFWQHDAGWYCVRSVYLQSKGHVNSKENPFREVVQRRLHTFSKGENPLF